MKIHLVLISLTLVLIFSKSQFAQWTTVLDDGKYYIGGYGPNDEGFVACFSWEGDSV